MYEHTLHKGSIAESPNKGNNRVLLLIKKIGKSQARLFIKKWAISY